MTPASNPQAVTPPTDEKLEKLMDDFERKVGWPTPLPREIISAARAALREYVSATTLTAEETEIVLNRIEGRPSPSIPRAVLWDATGKMHRRLDAARRASMKEHPDV